MPSYDSYFKMSVRAELLLWQDDGQLASHPIRPLLVDTELRSNVHAFQVLSAEPVALALLAPEPAALATPEPAGWQLLALGASVFAFIRIRRSGCLFAKSTAMQALYARGGLRLR
jgi:hypothetical protein